MSRGFVKEDDQEETPIIPPRAALPAGTTNYVTSVGLLELKNELKKLDHQIGNLAETDDRERRRALAVLNGKRNLLIERINTARTLDKIKDIGEIRFGAIVTYIIEGLKKPVTIQIVGVDEANVTKQKIAFTAPIARSLVGKRLDDIIDFKMGNKVRKITIKQIEYPTE
ncbi:GreA/GreB family elongation factor [Dokdonia sp. Hel_I_53]|uniref:GreA/GreB family elongation factor n=1 Tax=Dokdonia sp. Hel_I_53 TaxID=1566287 RepID=UPI0011994117|nr:GreA/GreB family elongation factor [Dokdonia sp. Hel_I_53]TVZ50993.1 transcription elongation factor GreB [Dokdonia sp. Hel_I_53]